MRRLALVGLVFLFGCDAAEEETPKAAGPTQVETPVEVVTRLYAMEHPPADQAGVESVFTTDWTPGLAPATGHSRLDWDYRYDVQPSLVHPSDVTYSAQTRSRLTARVTVSFKNSDTPDTMAYDLCLRPDGHWRIRNIIDTDQGSGSLRYVVGLGPVRGTDCP